MKYPGPSRIPDADRSLEELHRVTGSRRIDNDQIGDLLLLQRLDPPEHEQVLDAGRRGCHDFEQPGLRHALRDASETMCREPLDQCSIGGDRAATN